MQIVIKSSSGSTTVYTSWIAEELNADCTPLKDLKNIGGYDLLVYGGCLHAVGINGYAAFKKHLSPEDYGKLIITERASYTSTVSSRLGAFLLLHSSCL